MNINDITWNTPKPYERQAHFASDRMAGTVPVWKKTAEPVQETNALALIGQNKKNIVPPSLSFGEILDVVNPLQHIPVINHAYRALSGDDLSPVAKIAGGTLYGGPLGGAVSLLNAASQEHAGNDLTSALWAKTSSNYQERLALAETPQRPMYRFNN